MDDARLAYVLEEEDRNFAYVLEEKLLKFAYVLEKCCIFGAINQWYI